MLTIERAETKNTIIHFGDGKVIRYERFTYGGNMKEEHGKIEGSLSVSEEYSLHGMVIGDIIVKPGGILQLRGVCCGNLTVEAGGSVYLHGRVNGDATNQGGQLEVYGMINGRLFRSAGITKVDKNAVVTGGLL